MYSFTHSFSYYSLTHLLLHSHTCSSPLSPLLTVSRFLWLLSLIPSPSLAHSLTHPLLLAHCSLASLAHFFLISNSFVWLFIHTFTHSLIHSFLLSLTLLLLIQFSHSFSNSLTNSLPNYFHFSHPSRTHNLIHFCCTNFLIPNSLLHLLTPINSLTSIVATHSPPLSLLRLSPTHSHSFIPQHTHSQSHYCSLPPSLPPSHHYLQLFPFSSHFSLPLRHSSTHSCIP